MYDGGDYFDQLRNPQTPNSDNSSLGQYTNGAFTVGSVDEVNGRGAQEVPAFIPTRNELVELAKYWAKVAIEAEFFGFIYACSGSTEIRLIPFAWRRVDRIADCVGEDEVGNAVEEVYEELAKTRDVRTWQIFRNGTPEERQAIQDEVAECIERELAEKNNNTGDQPEEM
jgi:hypothetical protein